MISSSRRGSPGIGAPGPTSTCTARASCTRPTTRACRSFPRPSCRSTASPGTRVATSTRAPRSTMHAPLVEELLDRVRRDGPLSSTDVEPRAAIEWYWRPTNQVRALLEALAEAGILGLARRDGNRRVYDLAERLFPADLLADRRPERDQRRHRLLSRYRAHGLLGRSGSAELWLGTAPGVRKGNDRRPDPRRPSGRAHRGRAPSPGHGRGRPRRALHARGGSRAPGIGGFVTGPIRRGRRRPGRRLPGAARSIRLGPRVPSVALRLRLRLGGLRPRREASLGLLRAAGPLRRSSRRAGRAAHRSSSRNAPCPRHVVGGGLRFGRGARFRGRDDRRARGACPVRGPAPDRAASVRPAIGPSTGRSAIASAPGAGSEVDADDPPGTPVAGLVARPDANVMVVPARPGDRSAGRRGHGHEYQAPPTRRRWTWK